MWSVLAASDVPLAGGEYVVLLAADDLATGHERRRRWWRCWWPWMLHDPAAFHDTR
jgi:hypothetical protein